MFLYNNKGRLSLEVSACVRNKAEHEWIEFEGFLIQMESHNYTSEKEARAILLDQRQSADLLHGPLVSVTPGVAISNLWSPECIKQESGESLVKTCSSASSPCTFPAFF